MLFLPPPPPMPPGEFPNLGWADRHPQALWFILVVLAILVGVGGRMLIVEVLR
jgi:hypothetical protein